MSLDNILLIPGLGGLNLQRVLFGAGEVGGIWDWSDRSTMFQDNFGTTPITASGQTRGLHLDKSKGLVPGPELVTNGTFDTDTAWNKIGTEWSISDGKAQRPVASVVNSAIDQNIAALVNKWVEVKWTILDSPGASSLTVTLSGATGVTLSTAAANGTYRAIGFAGGNSILRFTAGGTWSGSIDNISVRELPGNHRYQASAASRPQYIEDETGHYGLYDGVDDFDETNAVDFTGTDKMTFWWGGRKLSDAAAGFILELSANSSTNNGSFAILGPTSASQSNYRFASRGTVSREATAAGFTPPVSNVITGVGDISGDEAILRANGAEVASNLLDQGTGNYGNYKLYFGRRAGTSFPANIREYMTIIRGAQTTTSLIEQVERAVRGKIKGLTW